MNIKEELLDIVTDFIDCPREEIDTTVGLKFIGLNSFVTMSLISAIEEHFNTAIPDIKLSEFKTLDDIVRYLEETL